MNHHPEIPKPAETPAAPAEGADGGKRVRHVVGCMTGTSLDGLDAALTRVTGTGLDMTAEFVGMVSVPLPTTLRRTLLSMANGEAQPPIEFMRAARYLGVVHAEACAELIAKHGRGLDIDFVVAHGQTIWHAPADRLSWQLFDPWPIVRTLSLAVCYDLRQADLVAGGEGAPITPIADPILYRGQAQLVFNLGGICNYSYGSPTEIQGGDITVCNILLDGLIQRLCPGQTYDTDGELAASGSPQADLVELIGQAIGECQGPNSSLGRELFDDHFLDGLVKRCGERQTADVLASAIAAIVNHTDEVVESYAPDGVVLAGGGAKNRALIDEMRRRDSDGVDWYVSDELGIPCEAREAMGFAVLGALSADGVPITLPKVTGSETPGVAGVWATPHGPTAHDGLAGDARRPVDRNGRVGR